jgi:hypothetical protein
VAAFVPTLVIAYIVFGIFLAAASLFAHPVIASAIYAGTHVLVQLLFTPLLAGWAIWGGIAVSARSADVRAAQQLSMLVQLAAADHRRLDGAESDHGADRSALVSPPRCWPSTCSFGASWPRCSTANGS